MADNGKERVSIFIDGNNFYYGCKETIGTANIDFRKLIEALVGNRDLAGAHYYNCFLTRTRIKKHLISKINF